MRKLPIQFKLVSQVVIIGAMLLLSAPSAIQAKPLALPALPLNTTDFLYLSQDDIGGAANTNGDKFGQVVATGDFNADGWMDVAVGAPGKAHDGSGAGAGVVYVFQGSGGGPTQGKFQLIAAENGAGNSETNDLFGSALAAADFNGDGYTDLAVGSPGENSNVGVAYVFWGAAAGPLTIGRYIFQSTVGGVDTTGDKFGSALAAGNFNGDAYADLVAGDPGESSNSGAVYALWGAATNALTTAQLILQSNVGGANESGDQFGAALTVGNFNGDAYADAAVGDPGEDGNIGAVFALWGASANALSTSRVIRQSDAGGGNEAGDQFGAALASSNFNGDAYADLAVGDPGENGSVGAAFVFWGAGTNALSTGHFVFQTDAGGTDEGSGVNPPGDQFGFAVAGGDLNGDGSAELIVGSPYDRSGTTQAGSVYIFPGSSTGISTGNVASQANMGGSIEAGDLYGWSVATGDVNKEGVPDLIVGSPGEAPGTAPQGGVIFFNAGQGVTSVLTHGPVLGAVTNTTIKIWARSNSAATLTIQYKLPAQAWPGTTSAGVSLASGSDFVGVVSLSSLSTNTLYDYRVLLNGVVQAQSVSSFKTLMTPGAASAFTFTLGADTNFGSTPFNIFNKIAGYSPEFMLLMGDQIYADGIPDSVGRYQRKYKENFADPAWANFFKRWPVFMMWDDHEIINDWDLGQTGRYANARMAYDRYQGNHNPAPRVAGEIYHAFNAGQADFYMLDVRSYRSDEALVDNSSKTMLGATQKANLKSWLSASTAKFKFIVSSDFFNDFGTTGNDAWKGYTTERAEIFNYIKTNNICGVVLLSGDQHWIGAFKMTGWAPYYFYELSPTPLGISNRPKTTSTDPQILYKYDSSRAFGLIQVDTTVTPAKITLKAFDDKTTDGDTLPGGDEPLYSLTVTTTDIKSTCP